VSSQFAAGVNRCLKLHECRQLFIRMHNETLSVVAVRVSNEARSPVGINRRDEAPTPTGFAQVVGRDGSALPRFWANECW
jgi:hypothetical protein